MRRIILTLCALLISASAQAADNLQVTEGGAGKFIRYKDLGSSVFLPYFALTDSTGAVIYGAAGTANANVISVQGIASMTPLLATVTNAGTFAVQAAQASAAALNATVVGTGTFAVQAAATLAAETTKVIGTVNLAATPTTNLANIDSQTSRLITSATNVTAGSALATTSFVIGSRYLSTPPTFTNGQEGAFQIDSSGRLIVNCGTGCSASTSITSWGGGTLGAMANYGTSPGAVLVPGVNAFVTNTNANGAATAANSSPVTLPTDMGDPCFTKLKTNVAFSTGTSLTALISGTSAKNTYICSLSVVASAAGFFGLKAGTASDCSTGTPIALVGSLTAGSGMSLAANGGLTLGNGNGTIVTDKAAAAQAYNVCIVISGTTNMAGNLTYVQQ